MTDRVSKAKAIEMADRIKTFAAEIFAEEGFDAPKVKVTSGDLFKIAIESTPMREGRNGVNLNSEYAQMFRVWPEQFGLEADDLGLKFVTSKGEEFIFTGVAPRGQTRPLTADRVKDGQEFRFPPAASVFIKAARKNEQLSS